MPHSTKKFRMAWATGLCALFTIGLLVTLVGGAAAAPTAVSLGTAGGDRSRESAIWSDFAHVLFNHKEFVLRN